MPVALLNEIVLSAVAGWIGYKIGTKKEKLTQSVKQTFNKAKG